VMACEQLFRLTPELIPRLVKDHPRLHSKSHIGYRALDQELVDGLF
jgi:hypothetical protein